MTGRSANQLVPHTFTHSHIHTPTAEESATQGDGGLVRSRQGEGAVPLRDASMSREKLK